LTRYFRKTEYNKITTKLALRRFERFCRRCSNVDTMLRCSAHNRSFDLRLSLFALLPSCILFLVMTACGSGHSAAPVSTTPFAPIPTPSSIALSAPQLPALVGDTGQFTAQVMWSDGSFSDATHQAIWQTTVPGIVNIGADGSFTAQAVGSTTITASYSGLSSTTIVSVMDHFTLIAIPDTQRMVAQVEGGSMAMVRSEFNWIKDQQFNENIRVVAGEGDIVNSGDSIQQWTDADSIYRILDETTIPCAPVMGNHDYDVGDGMAGADRASRNYNQYFGPQRFASRTWYGKNTFPAGLGDNFYVTFDVGARHFMVLALEFLPRPEAILWAQSVLDAHPGYQAILLTHGYLNDDGSRISETDFSGTGFSYWGLSSATASDGDQLWNELIRKNPNIVAVLCGHTWPSQVRRDDENDNSGLVPQLKADFESDVNGGSGMLRIMKFYPGQSRIDVSSYSPYFDQWLTDPSNQFSISYGTAAAASGVPASELQ
jgi:Calcineurin-like phosphoesterase